MKPTKLATAREQQSARHDDYYKGVAHDDDTGKFHSHRRSVRENHRAADGEGAARLGVYDKLVKQLGIRRGESRRPLDRE